MAVMAALTAVLVALPSCGSDDGGVVIEAAAREWQFGPNTWTVPAGSVVEILFTNEGDMTHEWTLVDGTISTEAEYDPQAVLFTVGLVAPGDSVTATFPAPPPGTYTVGCFIPGHFGLGMVGTLTVTG
jgi:uncharacterized cupredoxin-like copper-binding protein